MEVSLKSISMRSRGGRHGLGVLPGRDGASGFLYSNGEDDRMTTPDAEEPEPSEGSFVERLVKVVVSIVVLVPVTVFLGYGGWVVLTLTAKVAGYDPETEDGDRLRERLFAWPERNREVMRTDGRADLPLRP